MSDPYIPTEAIRKSAREAYLNGMSRFQCPDDMIPYQALWTRYFDECLFEQDSEADPCAI